MRASSSRKILAACLALLLVSGSVPAGPVADLFGSTAVTASAEEDSGTSQGVDNPNTEIGQYNDPNTGIVEKGKCGDNATWSFDSTTGTLTISGSGAMTDYDNSADMPWHDIKGNITSVVIEEGITSIGSYAFSNCSSLKSVKLPTTLKTIGDNIFSNSALKSIMIPPNVESIGKNAFKGCTGITDVYFFPNPKNLSWDTNDGSGDFKENKATFCHVPGYYYDDYTTMHGSANVEFTGEESGQCGENAYWMLDFEKDKLLITGTGKMTNVGAWHDGKQDKFTSVEIENGITSIGDSVFDGFSNLTSVSIPDSVTSIGDCAFLDCESLTSITIPDSVTSIGKDAFWGCTGITDVYCYAAPANLTWDEYGCDDFKTDGSTVCHVPAEYLSDYNTKFGSIVNVTFCPSGKCGENATWTLNMDTGLLTISGSGEMYDTFSQTSQQWAEYKQYIKSVKIEDGITTIGNYAFYDFTGLTSITIPDSVKSIGESAFEFCEGLESVEIGSGVESIGEGAFHDCTSLTSVTIPDSVKSIGDHAFESCTSLKSVTIPDSVKSIGAEAFYDCTGITDVYCYAAPANLTWNKGGCDDFKEDGSTVCHVPAEYIETYNSEKFSNVNVRFEETAMGKCGDHATWLLDTDTGLLTISGTGAMYDYDYEYNGDTETVKSPWFAYKDNITSVVIENGITSIGNNAFYRFDNLTSVSIPDSVKSIGKSAFAWCDGLTSIEIPNSVTSIGESAFADCGDLESVEIGSGVTSIGNYAFSGCSSLTSITIPDSVKSIGSLAFQWCTGLKSITIPEKVTSIGDWAFSECTGLTSIKIPDSVKSIDEFAFHNCISLTSIEIPDSVTSIGIGAFYNCKSLTSVEIPKNVKSIGESAFASCEGLKSVEIGSGVTSIDNDAFLECTNITDVYCYAAPANLTWFEGDCNDFKKDGSTVCHVPAEYILTDYSEKFSDVNVTFVGDIVDMGEGIGEHLYGHSISLEGDIGVNFYLELSDELLASETAKMVFTVPDGSKSDYQELFVSTVTQDDNNKVTLNGKTYYKFKCRISAKDMASNITAQLVDGEKSGKKYTYSVKEYAEKMIAAPEKYLPEDKQEQGVALVNAMLKYGYYAREYFKEGSEFENFVSTSVAFVDVPVCYEYTGNYLSNRTLPEGVTFEGTTLSLKSETTLSLYFKGLPKETKFLCDDHTVETDTSGEYVIARVRGINAKELMNDLTVMIDGDICLSVEYNPMTYCYNVQHSSTAKTELKNVCHALYEYAEAAKLYFN